MFRKKKIEPIPYLCPKYTTYYFIITLRLLTGEVYDKTGDHREALIKMELPEYDVSYGGTYYTICRAIRFIGYVVVLVLLSYSLWRIHVIESALVATDRFANVSKIIALGNSNALHRRVARSIKSANGLVEQNGFEFEKELARGGMLTSKNETPLPPKKKLKSKEDFNELVNSLFDAIQRMHNDSDRAHFDRNMKSIFQAWFPVFDALLPSDLTENNAEATRNTRSTDKSSEESSEEKKDKQDKPRQARSPMYTNSDESSEEQTADRNEQKDVATEAPKKQSVKEIEDNKDEQKNSDESSEESKNRRKRSINTNSGESSESNSSESHEDKPAHQLQAKFDGYNRVDFIDRAELPVRRKYEQKSSESSESSEDSSEKKKNRNEYPKFYNNYYAVTAKPYYVKNDVSND